MWPFEINSLIRIIMMAITDLFNGLIVFNPILFHSCLSEHFSYRRLLL